MLKVIGEAFLEGVRGKFLKDESRREDTDKGSSHCGTRQRA